MMLDVRMPLRSGGVLALLCAASWCARADEPTAEFMAWWNEFVGGSADGPSIDGFMIEYTVSDASPRPTPAEIESLRNEIGRVKSHPRVLELQVLEKRLRDPTIATRFRLWRWGEEWRWSSEATNGSSEQVEYFDRVWTRSDAWQLTPNQLVVGDAETVVASIYRIDVSASGIASDLTILFDGQLSAARAQGITLIPTMSSETSWTAHGQRRLPNGTVMDVSASGTWDQSASSGTLLRRDWEVKSPEGAAELDTLEFAEWRTWPGLDRPVASAVVVSINGVPQRRLDVLAIEPYSKEQFRELVRVPALDGNDVIRGPSTYRSVVELRGGKEAASQIVDGDSQTIARNDILLGKRSSLVSVLGWALAAALLIALVCYRLMRRSSSSP